MNRDNTFRVDKVFLIFAIVVTLILVLLASFEVYLIASTKKAVNFEKNALTEEKLRLETLRGLKNQRDLFEQKLDFYKKLMPSEPNEDELIRSIQDSSIDSKTSFIQVRFDARIPSEESFIEMPIKITFQGNYKGLVELLNNMKTGERLIRIDDIKVGKGQDGIKDIKADISASCFYLDSSEKFIKEKKQIKAEQ